MSGFGDIKYIREFLVNVAPARGQVNSFMRTCPTENGSLAWFGRLDTRRIVASTRALEALEERVLAEHTSYCFLDVLQTGLVDRKCKSRQNCVQAVVQS